MKWIVKEDEDGQRLDVFLTGKIERTRSQIQNCIHAGDVLVNAKIPAKTGYKVCAGDTIIVEPKTPSIKSQISTLSPKIILETRDYLVINKPSGMVVHATSHEAHGTVVDWLLERYPDVRGVGDDPLRPGIVHRLDKDASGVMVVAKNQESFDSLKRQFKLRRVAKEYLILVYGTVTPREGVIDLPITRAASHSTRFVGSKAGERQAVTNYIVERLFEGFSLVRAKPETGRTHQIRVHFYSRGYPLVGDTVYESKKLKKKINARLMLHASRLGFRDLAGREHTYTCQPGKTFEEVLQNLK